MSWNIGDITKPLSKAKIKMVLQQIVLTTPKTSPEKPTLFIAEMQQKPYIKNPDSNEEIFCLKRTMFDGRRKVCVNFKTDTNQLNIVVQCTVTEIIWTSKTVRLT